MKRAYAAVILFLAAAALVSGCFSQAQYPKNATLGADFYDFNRLHYWKDSVVMSANGVNATWNMTVYVANDTLNGTPARYLRVVSEGNGMNITYDVWSNATTYGVLRMHAKGATGDYFQDRDTAKQQIYTLPDLGLSYYFVPFPPVRSMAVRTPDGNALPVTIYSATNNVGFTVSYMISPGLPVPLKVEMADKNYRITQSLLEYG